MRLITIDPDSYLTNKPQDNRKKSRENLLSLNWAASSFYDAVKGNRNNRKDWQPDTIVQLATLSALNLKSLLGIRIMKEKCWKPASRHSKSYNRRSGISRQIQLLFQIFPLRCRILSLFSQDRRDREGIEHYKIVSDWVSR